MSETVEAAFVGAIIGASVGALGALLVSLVNNRFAEDRRKAEQDKWYAEHFLRRKVDAFIDLYSALIDAKTAITWNSVGQITSYDYFLNNVSKVVDKYEIRLARAYVYLDEDSRKALARLRGKLRQSSLAIWFTVPDKQIEIVDESYAPETKVIPWSELNEAYNDALVIMEELLSPEVLKGFAEGSSKN